MATLKSIPDLLTEASTNVPDNTTQQVSPQDLRELTENTAFSSYNKITDASIVGLKDYDTGISYPSGQWVSYLGDIYQANTTTTPGAFTPAEWTVFSGGSGGNFADTDLTVTANRNHDVAGFTLTYDNGIISNTNMQFGVNGNFNVTSNGALGNDIAQFISSSANPVLIASNANEAVVIGNTAPTASAVLDVNSTTKGMLVPRMTTTERDLISTPAESLLIYNTTTDQFEFRNSAAAWEGLSDTNIGNTDLTLSSSRLLDIDSNVFSLETSAGSGSRVNWVKRGTRIAQEVTSGGGNIFKIGVNHSTSTAFDGTWSKNGYLLGPTSNASFDQTATNEFRVYISGGSITNLLLGNTSVAPQQIAGDLVIRDDVAGGANVTPSARFHVIGADTLSGSSVLLVQDGDTVPNDLFDVRANGDLYTEGSQGLNGTYNFGGGGSGDVLTMTFTNGILTGTTLVP